MINVMMVCHGNICRSTMAEFVLKDMVEKEGLADKFHIESSATSREEIGNPVHHGTRKKLAEVGISTAGKYARQITKKDYKEFDYILIMDDMNRRNLKRVVGEDVDNKVYKLLHFAGSERDIADPWTRFKKRGTNWFSSKWSVPKEAYLESMRCFKNHSSVIIGGLGVIENASKEKTLLQMYVRVAMELQVILNHVWKI